MTGMKKHIRGITVIVVLFALSIAAIVVCVGIGTIEFTPREVIRAIFTDDGSPSRLIVWNLRLPRILTGGLVGICLALSGCVLQGVMRNNLASPSTIGVTGGASFVGYLTLVAFPAYSYLLPVGSIAGAFVTTMLIYALAYQKGVSPVRMILSGMAVSALFGAFNDIIKTLFAESLGNASGFLVGGLNGCGWGSFRMILPYALAGMVVCLFLPSKMNILMLGDETANSLGLRTELFRFILIAPFGCSNSGGRNAELCRSHRPAYRAHTRGLRLPVSFPGIDSSRVFADSYLRHDRTCDNAARRGPRQHNNFLYRSAVFPLSAPFARKGGELIMYFGFKNIAVDYGKKKVLSGLSLDVPKGKIMTLIGQNGCGKSTLLKVIPRAVTPKTGCCELDCRSIREYRSKLLARRIAYLAQVHTSPPDIDVRTLVSYGRYPYMKPGRGMTKADGEIVDNIIRMTGLEKLSAQPLSTLSGGERQRAWIAMTVAQEPEILVLDEPTTYLDIGYQIEVLELVKNLNRTLGITILMVLHDLNLAARYSDILAAIKDGRVYVSGTPTEVLTVENLRTIFGIGSTVTRDEAHDCPFFIPE